LLLFLKNKIEVEIFFDDRSEISQFIEKKLDTKSFIKKNPTNIHSLIESIEQIEYGIFVDSGPLHVSKIMGKKGILVETSVSEKVLLNNYNKIKVVKNQFSSKYCNATCGLIDIFSYKNKVGCYSSAKINQNDILDLESYHSLQRRDVKKNNLFYLLNPVGCVEAININNIKKLIEEDIF